MGNYTTHGTALSTPQVLGSQKRIRTAREQAPMACHVPSSLSCKTGHVSTPHRDRAGDPGTPTKGGHARGRAHVPSKHNLGTKCLPQGNHLQSPPRCQGTSPSPAGHVGGWRNTWGLFMCAVVRMNTIRNDIISPQAPLKVRKHPKTGL